MLTIRSSLSFFPLGSSSFSSTDFAHNCISIGKFFLTSSTFRIHHITRFIIIDEHELSIIAMIVPN